MNASDYFTTAVHESGHHVAADYFHIPSYPEVTPGGRSVLAATPGAHAGICYLENPITKFQDAVICWSGIMAQCMFATAPEWAPPFKPTKKMLKDWHGMVRHQVKQLSDEDRIGIFGYKDTWRACKSAFAILSRNRARITRLAKYLAEAKAKVDREAAELEKVAAEWAANRIEKRTKISTAEIAVHLQNVLTNYLPDVHPLRATYERALACLKRGEEIPAELIAELEKK